MRKYGEQRLNLEPLHTLLTEDIKPEDLSKLFDELLCDYIAMIIRIQLSDCKDKTIHENADNFISYLKLLRDILPYCTTKIENP